MSAADAGRWVASMLTFGSLFAGIGGFDLGLERAGMVCKWQVEIDPFCQRVLAKHWPNVQRYSDVKDCGSHNLEPVDVICGGFPCQPHSVAGQRKGADDDRDLWPEYRRIIEAIRPAYIIGENVTGIISTILDQVLSDLDNIGYTSETFVIPACAFNAPHRRDRVWIVAYSEGVSIGAGLRASEQTEQRRGRSGNGSSTHVISNSTQPGLEGSDTARNPRAGGRASKHGQRGREADWWSVEPGMGRMAYGVPDRVDRLTAIGNAIVPQVAQFVGECVIQHATQQSFAADVLSPREAQPESDNAHG
jgi:DNA (cytosine-5)-methyltransferase 1